MSVSHMRSRDRQTAEKDLKNHCSDQSEWKRIDFS